MSSSSCCQQRDTQQPLILLCRVIFSVLHPRGCPCSMPNARAGYAVRAVCVLRKQHCRQLLNSKAETVAAAGGACVQQQCGDPQATTACCPTARNTAAGLGCLSTTTPSGQSAATASAADGGPHTAMSKRWCALSWRMCYAHPNNGAAAHARHPLCGCDSGPLPHKLTKGTSPGASSTGASTSRTTSTHCPLCAC